MTRATRISAWPSYQESPGLEATMATAHRICSIVDCERILTGKDARGWCNKHYLRWRKHGSPVARVYLTGDGAEARFWQKVDKDTGRGCWLWLGALDKDGYGRFRDDSQRMTRVHRFAYELLVAPIPEGLVLDLQGLEQQAIHTQSDGLASSVVSHPGIVRIHPYQVPPARANIHDLCLCLPFARTALQHRHPLDKREQLGSHACATVGSACCTNRGRLSR